MNEIPSDTHPEIAALQRNLLRQAGSARKLAMLGQMNQTVKTLAISGLQSRYPGDSPNMLRRRLADLVADIQRSQVSSLVSLLEKEFFIN